MSILMEVRVRQSAYQDHDIKVTIEKTGFFGNKRKVYGIPWGVKEETWSTWVPIEFTVKDLTEENNFGEYQKYYEAYIKERDQPTNSFIRQDFHQRNNLEFSPEWNSDLDIIKLYILINTEKYKDDAYEWHLIEDPIKGEKGGPAPYYRSFGVDSYCLNNGASISINWDNANKNSDSLGKKWSDDKGNEINTPNPKFYFDKERIDKSNIEKEVFGIRLPEGVVDPNVEGTLIRYKSHYVSQNKEGKTIYAFSPNEIENNTGYSNRGKYGGLFKDTSILDEIIRYWKMNVSGYEDLAVVNNIHGTPAIYNMGYFSGAADYKKIEYKSPFGTEIGPSASGPSASGPSASEPGPSASGPSASTRFKPTFEGIKDGYEIAAKKDLPNFSIYVGDPKKDWPKVGAGELPAEGEEYENLEGAEVLDEEYMESPYTGPEEEVAVVDGFQIKMFNNEELRRDDSQEYPDGSGEGVSFGGSDVVSPSGSVSNSSVILPSDLKSVRNSNIITRQEMGNGHRNINSDIVDPSGGRVSGADITKSMNEFVKDVLGPFATWLKDKYPGLYKAWYITSATRGYVPTGGSLTSQHMKGQAIDSQILGSTATSPDKNIELCNAILEWYKLNPVGYGQILFETRGSSCWIHWSYTRGAKRLDFKRFSNDKTKSVPANKAGAYVLPPLKRSSLGF